MRSYSVGLFVVLILTMSVFAGCSTALVVSPLSGTPQREGVVYFLPRAQFDITLTRELSACDPVNRSLIITEELRKGQQEGDRQAHASGMEYGRVFVDVKTAAVVTPRYAPDPTQAYLIDYQRLNTPLKKTDLKVELFDRGTLKSVNVTVEDRTREVLAQAVRGITSLATLALPSTRIVVPKAVDKKIEGLVKVTPLQLCTELTVAALQKVKRLTTRITSVETELGQTEEQARRKELEEELSRLQNDLSNARKHLTYAHHYSLTPSFLPRGPSFTVDRIPLEPGTANLWFDQAAIQELSGKLTPGRLGSIVETHPEQFKHWKKVIIPEELDSPQFHAEFPLRERVDPGERYPRALDVFVNVVVEHHHGNSHAAGTGQTVQEPKGLVYRAPADGEVMLCLEGSCVSQAGILTVPREARLFSRPFAIPQAGAIVRLPLHNGAFDVNTIVASFSEAGTLTNFHFTTEAEAERAATALAETVEALTKIRIEPARAETEQLEAETKRLDALKKKVETERALKKAMEQLE